MATVLGLSCFYHDSAAALVRDGEIVAAAAEERFTRRKHTNEFPKEALSFCLSHAELRSIDDLDAIVFYEKPVRKFLRVVDGLVSHWPFAIGQFGTSFPAYLKSKLNVRRIVGEELPAFTGPILFSEHHLSHAAAAFYCSPFAEAAVLTVDGVGERETTTLGWGSGRDLRLERAIHFPHSIGLLFSALTAYLGFRVNDAEWKVMGLAPYGAPSLVDAFRKLISVKHDGSFHLNLEYFAFEYSAEASANERAWIKLFGFPPRREGEPIEDPHRDLARSGQQVLEEVLFALVREAKRAHPACRHLVIGGGVGLNSVANGKLQAAGIFDDVWIQPAAGDDGGALGAALAASVLRFGDPRPRALDHVYLGPGFDPDEVRQCLECAGFEAERRSETALLDAVADLLAEGKVVAWFDGRMEFGPRSLGARSILASPLRAEMKERVNRSIKFREPFRPFAPAVLRERVHEYFAVPPNTAMPFMTKVAAVRPERRAEIPAVTHVDGSGRVQTVAAAENPRFHRLIEAFAARTGTPVLLNTSFNVRGEPIVCTPQEALDCFERTDLDALVLGDFLVRRARRSALDVGDGHARSDQLEAGLDVGAGAYRRFSAVRDEARNFSADPPGSEQSAVDCAKALIRNSSLAEYVPLHRYLQRSDRPLRVLDVGSGTGGFANRCAYFYGHDVTGIETNPAAVRRARAVARLMGMSPSCFLAIEAARFAADEPFDVVNCLGGPAGLADGEAVLRHLSQSIRPGGFLHLGVFHSYSRQPFLEHFAALRLQGMSIEKLFDEYARFFPPTTDRIRLEPWFHDQVLQPRQRDHSYAEVRGVLERCGITVRATSINGYAPLLSEDAIVERERSLREASRKALRKKRYFPGYFIVWAQRIATNVQTDEP